MSRLNEIRTQAKAFRDGIAAHPGIEEYLGKWPQSDTEFLLAEIERLEQTVRHERGNRIEQVRRKRETHKHTRGNGIDCQGGCGLSFSKWADLRAHLDLVPDPQYPDGYYLLSKTHIGAQAERVWPCPRCELLFFHDDPLSDHIHYDHDDGEYAL